MKRKGEKSIMKSNESNEEMIMTISIEEKMKMKKIA